MYIYYVIDWQILMGQYGRVPGILLPIDTIYICQLQCTFNILYFLRSENTSELQKINYKWTEQTEVKKKKTQIYYESKIIIA